MSSDTCSATVTTPSHHRQAAFNAVSIQGKLCQLFPPCVHVQGFFLFKKETSRPQLSWPDLILASHMTCENRGFFIGRLETCDRSPK